MAYFDTGYVNVTFYGVSYGIRVDGNADRNDGSTAVRFYGTTYDKQNTNIYNTDAHYSNISELLGNGQIKPSGTGAIGRVYARGFDTTLGIGIGTTSRGFTANFNGGGNSHNIGFTAWFNDGYSAPEGIALSGVSVTENSIAGTVSLSNWGNHSGGSKYRELTASSADGDISNRRFQGTGSTDVLSSAITVTNSSAQSGSMNLNPNTRYYLAVYASNGNRNTGIQYRGNAVTLSTGARTVNKIKPSKILFDVTAMTGVYAPTVKFRYRKQGDTTWIVSTASFTGGVGSVELTGLSASTTYELQQMVTTQAGTWYSSTFTVKTKPASIIIYPDGTKKNVSFRLIYPNGTKRDIERWKKIINSP